MKISKFIFYSAALSLGLIAAFCTNPRYDDQKYSNVDTLSLEVDSEKKTVQLSESYKQGKKLFKANCQSCHNKNMIDDLTGPALKGTLERWEGREDLLYDWVRNSAKVIASGDSYAVELYNEYNKSVMTAFPNLEDQEIENLLDYIEGKKS